MAIVSSISRLKTTMTLVIYHDGIAGRMNNTHTHCPRFLNHIPVPIAQQNHNLNVNVTLKALCREGQLKEAIHIMQTINTHNSPHLVDSSTCLQLLQTCIAKKALSEGKLIHSHMDDIGFTFTVFWQNKLIQMYVNCGSLADACKVFGKMTERDVFSWSMIISAYQRHGYHRQALALFHQMQESQTGKETAARPNEFIFPSVLQACAKLGDLHQGLTIHQTIIKTGFSSDVVVASALIDMYAKCGGIEKARELLHQMQQTGGSQPTEFIFPSIIQACAELGDLKQGLYIHQKLFKSGYLSDDVVVSALVGMYAKCGRVHKARELFDKMSRRSTVLWTVMIVGYAQCGLLGKARELFDQMPRRDAVSWNAMIAGYAQNGLLEKALEILKQMQYVRVKPSSATFASILPVCAKMGALDEGTDIHQRIVENGLLSDVVVATALIDMYAKCGRIHKARELFDKMHNANTVSWNAMIAGYAQNGLVDEARELFDRMPCQDAVSWTSIIAGYAQNGLVDKARELFDEMPRQAATSWNAMIAGYAQNGLVEESRKLFDIMPQRNAVSWNAMIAGYAQNGLLEKALDIFEQMQLADVKPSSATFVSILPTCAKMGALEQGMDIHQRINECGFSSDVVVASALIDMYAKCGSIHKARELFDRMHNGNSVSWTVMIAGYAMHGYSEDALKLFELMKHLGTNPDSVSFVCVLFACSHAGLVDEGCQYFNSMSDSYWIMPTVDHYVCIVDLLGRAGYLEEALNFIFKMPIKPEMVVWMCLLGACRSHKNIEIGEFVARILFVLDPIYAASYVLLSNIYAEVGRWDDVQKVRKLMKDRTIKKTPGCSWIEVHKTVHCFL